MCQTLELGVQFCYYILLSKNLVRHLFAVMLKTISHVFILGNNLLGPVVGELLDKIIPMLTANMNPDKDAEVRLKLFTLVSRLVQNSAETLNSTNRSAISSCYWPASGWFIS